MKKAVSIILTLTIIFSLSATASANYNKCNCGFTPVIHVPGFGEPIHMNPGDEDNYTVFPPEGDAITKAVPDLVTAVLFGLLTGNFDIFGKHAAKAANTMLGEAACDKDGNPLYNTGVEPDELTFDTHKETVFVSEDADDNGYFLFLYDWRLDPLDNAKSLRTYINEVKKFTGHNKIILSAHSQGNTVVTSYLHLYGSNGIEKILFLSPAYNGLSLVGSLFTQDVSVLGKGDALADYLNGIMGYEDIKSQLITAIIKEINEIGTVDGILYYLQEILDDQLDRVFAESLTDIIGTLPGIWAFVPDEYYEEAKETVFKGNAEFDNLVARIDYYHYNVQQKTESIIRSAKANGTAIIITSGYNISSIPVTGMDEGHSDFLIDTKYMSLGAVCAPFGETFDDNYIQQKNSCSHNHVSSDKMIDASTCAFPEYTWFIKNNGHSTFEPGYCGFLEWIIRFNGQPTVHSNPDYPQFIKHNGDTVIPVEQADVKDTRSNEKIIFSSIIALIKESF